MPSPVVIGIGPVSRRRIWGIFVERHMVARFINPKDHTVRPLRVEKNAPTQTQQEYDQIQTKHQLSHFTLPQVFTALSRREVGYDPIAAPDWIIRNLPLCLCVSVVNQIKHFTLPLLKSFLQDGGE